MSKSTPPCISANYGPTTLGSFPTGRPPPSASSLTTIAGSSRKTSRVPRMGLLGLVNLLERLTYHPTCVINLRRPKCPQDSAWPMMRLHRKNPRNRSNNNRVLCNNPRKAYQVYAYCNPRNKCFCRVIINIFFFGRDSLFGFVIILKTH